MTKQGTQYQYYNTEKDEDNVALNALHDAGALTEAAITGDASTALYEQGLEVEADAIIGLMTGSFSASILFHALAEKLEHISDNDIETTKENLRDMLNDGTLTDAKKQELEEYLRLIENNPDLLNSRK